MFVPLNKNQANISKRYNKQGRSNMMPASATKIPHINDAFVSQRNDCQVGKHDIHIYCVDVSCTPKIRLAKTI
jgi:hypothetical protein